MGNMDEAPPLVKCQLSFDLRTVEKVIVEDAFRAAVEKLGWVLPFDVPDGKKWQRLEELSGGMDTSVLRNVVLDTLAELNRDNDGKLVSAGVGEKNAQAAISAMFGHVYAREVIERNQFFGNKLLQLLTASVLEHDGQQPYQLRTINAYLQSHDDFLALKNNAELYQKRNASDSEAHLAEVMNTVAEVKSELKATLEAWRIHEKQMDNEVYETNARIDVELAHTEDFTDHQLHYLAFAREFAEDALYKRRLRTAREVEFSKLIHRSAMELLDEYFEQQDQRHVRVRTAEEDEQVRLETLLRNHNAQIENMEGDLMTLRLAHQHHNEIITHLRQIRAEEIAQEEKLIRYMNAVVRIQRWWRFQLWKNRKKKKKKKKGKKGRKGKKSKGKSKSKSKKK